MKLIIDIPEEQKKMVDMLLDLPPQVENDIVSAIRHGTPLTECEDTISRQEAVSRISDLLMLELQGKRLPTWNEIYNALCELPSVQPKAKEEVWEIRTEKVSDDPYYAVIGAPYCTNCGEYASYPSRYCPNCGTKMCGAKAENGTIKYFDKGGKE